MSAHQNIDFNNQSFYRDSVEIFARLREQEPVYQQANPWGGKMWYITRYEDVDTVLRDGDTFAIDFKRAFDPQALEKIPAEPQVMAMVNSHLLTKDGEDHRRLRALVSKAFTPRRIAGLRPRIEAIAEELLDQVQGQGRMDLVESYAFPLPITVIAEMLGIPAADRARFREWSDAFVTAPFTGGDDTAFFASAMGFVSYLGQVFEERRREPKDDLISALLQAEEAGDRLNTEELFSMVVLLIIAGHETTVSLIGNAAVVVMSHPELKERLTQHPEEMPQAVEEFLRYTSPVQRSLARFATRDVQIGGAQIRRGDMVITVLGSANRDEAAFHHPDEIDIQRDNKNHMAFGRGIHYCLGAPLARLEGEIALNTLLKRLPNLRLAALQEQMEYRETPLFRAFTRIPVEW